MTYKKFTEEVLKLADNRFCSVAFEAWYKEGRLTHTEVRAYIDPGFSSYHYQSRDCHTFKEALHALKEVLQGRIAPTVPIKEQETPKVLLTILSNENCAVCGKSGVHTVFDEVHGYSYCDECLGRGLKDFRHKQNEQK